MSGRPAVKSAFENLRPTIMREPTRSTVSVEAEERLLKTPARPYVAPSATVDAADNRSSLKDVAIQATQQLSTGPLLLKKKRERLLLVSFRMPQGLKEQLELVAKKHEINQTDIINEAIQMNLQRYL